MLAIDSIPWNEITATLGGIILIYLRKALSKLTQVTAQVTKNGGKSLADSVSRIESKVTEVNAMNIVERQLDERPMFKTNDKGEFLWVNLAFKDAAGMSSEDAKGHGWITIISENDRDRVKREWQSTVQDARKFLMNFHITAADSQKSLPVKCKAFPIIIEGALRGYYGIFYVQHEQSSNSPKAYLD